MILEAQKEMGGEDEAAIELDLVEDLVQRSLELFFGKAICTLGELKVFLRIHQRKAAAE